MHFDPEALLNPKDPLEEAAKFAQPLHMLGCNSVTGYALAFEVYFRKVSVPSIIAYRISGQNFVDAKMSSGSRKYQ